MNPQKKQKKNSPEAEICLRLFTYRELVSKTFFHRQKPESKTKIVPRQKSVCVCTQIQIPSCE